MDDFVVFQDVSLPPLSVKDVLPELYFDWNSKTWKVKEVI